MAIKVIWTDFAKAELRKIFDYYKVKASPIVAKSLVKGIVKKGNTLDFQTKIGQKEELLSERPQEFRYLIYKNYKIIYWYNQHKNWIEINDVFDTRQNPIKIRREK